MAFEEYLKYKYPRRRSIISIFTNENGVQAISIDYDDNRLPIALTFFVMINQNPVNFRLPSNWVGIKKLLDKNKKIPKNLKTEEQAIRISWRILKDWIEAQMAIIQCGLAELPEVFLPYAVTANGDTLFNALKSNNMKFLEG